MKLKKGDTVLVVIGRDRGKKGKIEHIFEKRGKIQVAGVNIYKRHLKARGENQPGGIIDVVKPLSVAKVALVCPKCNQQTRVGYKILHQTVRDKIAGKEKIRICRKCNEVI